MNGGRSLLLAASLPLLLAGCANLGYYWQSVSGQLDVWRRERPVVDVISDSGTPAGLRQKLARIAEIRDFASRELGLPDNRSYRGYADLDRPFAVWNVFAAPEFSVQPLRWCFVFAGCVGYRGYFTQAEADRYAAGLAQQGYDVHVGGVPAYSMLGWFPDPLLSTFVHYPEAEVAAVIFHELAHQAAYAGDDTVFNESFAAVVEQEGVRRWLARTGDARQREAFERRQRFRAQFVALGRKYRERLDTLYRTRLAPEAMRDRKAGILRELEQEYLALKQGDWGGYAGYDRWFAQQPNNAQLASVAIYTDLVPAFEALLGREGGDLACFYRVVRELAVLPKEEREARLRALAPAATGSPRPEGQS